MSCAHLEKIQKENGNRVMRLKAYSKNLLVKNQEDRLTPLAGSIFMHHFN